MIAIVPVLAWVKKHHDIVAAVAIVFATTGAYGIGKVRGASKAHAEDAAAAEKALQVVSQKYREREIEHAQAVSKLQSDYAAKVAAASAVDAQMDRDLDSGVVRMRLPVASRCPRPATPGAPAARIDATETAELAPATARSLYSIAAQGDAAIEQLNALQAWARQAVRLCNGGKP